ncbi:MAG: hypothetical protein STSR0009_20210 [Methanoregula sp.]
MVNGKKINDITHRKNANENALGFYRDTSMQDENRVAGFAKTRLVGFILRLSYMMYHDTMKKSGD